MDNNKYIAFILEQETLDFKDIFEKFPEQEQEAFLNFLCELMATMMFSLKDCPTDIKKQVVMDGLGRMPDEIVKELAVFIRENPDWK